MSGSRMPAIVSQLPQRWARVEATGVREYLAFLLGREAYALPLSCVREIMRVPTITDVPRAPHEMLGIVSVRGKVTTLIDLRRKLRVVEAAIGTRTRVLLVDQGDEILGLLCDRVLQVHRLSEDQVEMASVLGSEASSYVMGIGRPGKRKTSAAREAKAAQAAAKAAQAAVVKNDEPVAGDDDILILLDPIVLLKRQANG